MKKEKRKREKSLIKTLLVGLLIISISLSFVLAADPDYADSLIYGTNETKGAGSSISANVSGGYISTFNLTATVQNDRWKAFIGHITGSFTLDDSAGSTIYDWSFSSNTGRVYATRNSSTINWAGISCATVSEMETENTELVLNSSDDNVTSTFADSTHDPFPVGSTNIGGDSCPTLNTFVNSLRDESGGQPFEEMVLHDGESIVFATIIENDITGYNGEDYDFQMIVPENGSSSFTGNTLYYMYMELGN